MSLEEARDPKTSPERLAALAKSDDIEVRWAVTQNPNTPVEVLFTLGAELPDALLQNPLLTLLLLEQPTLMYEMPKETAGALLLVPTLPVGWLKALARHRDVEVCSAVARHLRAPPEALEDLAR